MSTFQRGNVTPRDLECLNSRAMLQRLHRHSIDILNIKELHETQDLPSGRTSHTRRISALEFEQRDLNTVAGITRSRSKIRNIPMQIPSNALNHIQPRDLPYRE